LKQVCSLDFHLYNTIPPITTHLPLSSFFIVCKRLIDTANNSGVTVKGPIRIPTKVLRITTRKTPCGEGSKTWDRYELRIHKRVVDLQTTPEMVKQIVTILFVIIYFLT
jgi:ribosomal protein uS10